MKTTLAAVVAIVLAMPAFTFAQTTCPSLSRGSTGASVTAVQKILYSAYNNFPSPTGYFGPLTQAAVKQWQKEHGIEQTGTVGPKTAAAMKLCTNIGSTASQITSTVPGTSISRTLTRGMSGSDVVALQKFLITQKLLSADSATGFFGALTEAAVKKFQASKGIVSSGTPATTGYGAVGPRTRDILERVPSQTSAPSRASTAQGSYGGGYSQANYYSQASYTSASTTPATSTTPQTACTFDVQSIASGASVTAYQAVSVPSGSQCVSQRRGCTNGTLSGTYQYASCVVDAPLRMSRAQYDVALAALAANRASLWRTTFGDWEVWYDGYDTPFDNVPMAFAWDNPIDDDSLEDFQAGKGFRVNTPSPGYLTVDRTTDQAKGSVISRRDEFLHKDAGFTLEFGVKILPQSREDGFMAYYVAQDGWVQGIFLSPNAVRVGGYNQHRLGFDAASVATFDTTSDYHVYRLVQPPGQNGFTVYVDGQRLLDGYGNGYSVSSISDVGTPHVIIGGESVGPTAYILDFVRYRRGASAPGESMPAPTIRTPPPLPSPRPTSVQENFVSFPNNSNTLSVFWPLGVTPVSGPFPLTAGMTGAIGQLPGITNKGDITIEARIKVLQSSGRRGFSMIYLDGKGSIALFLSPDKAELAPGMKNVGWRDVGFQSSSLDTTDRFHTYRIVRPANSMYSYLYIDGNPIPAVYDQHADGHMGSLFLPEPVIEFGAGAHPEPWRSTTNVQIEYIRWAPTAYAPVAP